MNNKIITVIVSLSKDGFKTELREWDFVEKPKTYVLSRVDKYGEKNERHLKKDRIGSIETGMFVNHNSWISFNSRVFPDKVEETEAILKKEVINQATNFKAEIDALWEHVISAADEPKNKKS